MHFFVTGGAGFIGSNLVDYLLGLHAEHRVTVFDDLSTGRIEFLEKALSSGRCRLVRGDIRELADLQTAMLLDAPTWVIHLAANADVRFGTDRPRRDLDYNTIGTWNVAEAARLSGCKRILFSSTGSVYGEPRVFPTPEEAPFPEQTSLYGASKLAGEGILSAYAHGFGMTTVVMRFVSILGPRYTHGHIVDFVKQLAAHPLELKVLGDGYQNKSYLHVNDLMKGIWTVLSAANEQPGFHVFNIGHNDSLTVRESIAHITQRMGLDPMCIFSGGTRGWIGDSPKILLDTSKIKKLGWTAELSLQESVQLTVDDLLQHPHRWQAEDQSGAFHTSTHSPPAPPSSPSSSASEGRVLEGSFV